MDYQNEPSIVEETIIGCLLTNDKLLNEFYLQPKHFLNDNNRVIMLYKDYKKDLGTSNVDIYLRLAKSWLMDDDVEMKHGEKLAAYYDNVVMAD